MLEGTEAGTGHAPNPSAAPGTDQIPLIENIVCVMMENHSYDNILGMMQGRGDGFTLGSHGNPTASNPWPKKSTFPPPLKNAVLNAFPMPNPCQEVTTRTTLGKRPMCPTTAELTMDS